jgi:hypothetical protein
MVNSRDSRYVVNPGTGEVETTINPGDRIIRGKSQTALDKQRGKESISIEWNLGNFFKTHIPEMRLWMNDLSGIEKILLFSIVPYISFEDCHLQYENGVDMGSEDLVKISGMSRAATYDAISSLVRKDILYKGKNSKGRQFFVNPWLFCKGNRVNKVLKTMFKNYHIRVLDGKKWKDITE